MKSDCPLVIIRWEDSAQPLAAWQHLSKLKPAEPIECATVGWLVRDDESAKVVCQSIGGLGNPANAQASGIMTIPTRCVLSIENLSECPPASALGQQVYCNNHAPQEPDVGGVREQDFVYVTP